MDMTTKTLKGPSGLTIILNSAEIFPSNPGDGTPAMVYLVKRDEWGSVRSYSATYWCALDTGELDCGEIELSRTQCAWLDAMQDTVADFVATWTPVLANGEWI
jgi:hypothetical protein